MNSGLRSPHPAPVCAGFNLVELSVALALGLVLVGAAATLVTTMIRHNERLQLQARLEDNARFALLFLSRELRMAGFYGCAGAARNGGTPLEAAGFSTRYGDRLRLQYANPALLPRAGDGAAPGTPLVCPPVADGGLLRHEWSVRKLSHLPSLYRRRTINQPMVEGIEYLRLLYGLDEDGDGSVDRVLGRQAGGSGPAIDFTRVISVRLGLLVRSTSGYRAEANPAREYGALEHDTRRYQVLDQVVDPPDLRVLRAVFTATVRLRNQWPEDR